MIKALLAILKLTGAISAASPTYHLLDTIADAAFFFLPVLLAYGASIKFECNPILAMTIAGALLHPNLAQMLAAGSPIDFIGIPVRLADYAGSVLPIIFTVWLMSYIERFAEKVSPTMIKFFTKPMIILLVTTPLALVAVGPFGIFLNDSGGQWRGDYRWQGQLADPDANGRAATVPGDHRHRVGDDAYRHRAVE